LNAEGVLHRKISGGRRTWPGAEAFGVLLSIYETSKKQKERFMEKMGKKWGLKHLSRLAIVQLLKVE